jgi:tetratricopeptide (TPR) repeat protein
MSKEIAERFLEEADAYIESKEQPERLLEALEQAEKVAADEASILCRSARLLFRYGLLHSKGQFLLLALDKLKQAEEKNPSFFKTQPIWLQLWGNILLQIGKLINDTHFFEMAIQKYRGASQILNGVDPELYWDWGDAWTLLGMTSGERADFEQALVRFHQAQRAFKGTLPIFFRLDYGNAFLHYGELIGNIAYVEESIALFRSVVADSYHPDHSPTIAYIAAWRKLAIALKVRFFLSHNRDHFKEADRIFREAILAHVKNSELWLDWGHLYLEAGWLRRDPILIESGLEKLTSLKAKECHPLRSSALLGMGLIQMGLFLDNFKLIKEGQERIQRALEIGPNNQQLLYAQSFATFGLALYFSDETAFAQTATLFEKGLKKETRSLENLHGLFQVYMAWGLQTGDIRLVKKGVAAIARLSSLRPCSSIHLNEWGVALLRLKTLVIEREGQIDCLKEAIEKFDQAAQLGDEEESLYNCGCAYDLLGDISGDEEDYCRAIELLSQASHQKGMPLYIRYRLGAVQSHLGELTLNQECLIQAIELFEGAIKIDGEDENIWCDLGYAQLNLSEILLSSFNGEEGVKYRWESEKSFIRAAELGCSDAYYHLACLYSLAGLHEASLRYLIMAASADCLPNIEDLQNDEWLEGVRTTDAFQEFLMARGGND